MSTDIYYFSGTGNSLVVARDISEKIEGRLIPIASLMDKKVITTDSDVVGIVFPVYYGEPPVIVKEFAKRLKNLEHKYIYAVCTYGGAASASFRVLRRIIRSNGGELSAVYGIHMPQNAFYKQRENHQRIYSEWRKKLQLIVKNTTTKAKCSFYSNIFIELLFIPMHPLLIKPICQRSFAKQLNMPSESKFDLLIRLMDKGFYSNEKCNGCGICSKVCPVRNINISNNKPIWQNHCENCLACYNWCPNKAILGGITSKGYYYKHPDIKISEMMH